MKVSHPFALLAFCFLSASRAADYFPLEPGNRWTYACERCAGNEAAVSVLRFGPGFIQVDFLGTEIKVSFTPRAGELDIELPGEGFVPYYRFNEESWLHRDVFSCDDRREIAAASRDEVVETPAGTFSGCLRLDYRDGLCQDGGTLSEWWKLGIGRVKWIESTIAGPRAWLLKSFEEGRKPTAFLRGDANGDGKVDLSDAVFTLVWLFGGGVQPACLDANDSDDNGQIQLTDAVRVLNFLFLGVGTIPSPGPFVPGFDATPDDPFTCGDPPLFTCHKTGSSTLPGVSFDLLDNPCTFTLAQAAQGVSLVYRTKIEHDLPGTTSFSLDAGRCDEPDESGLAVLEVITGGGQRYCICDSGRCPDTSHQRDLSSGIFEHFFQWDGKNWEGPSDTLNPKGPPFPPGTYEFTLRARGTYVDASGVEQPFEASASAELHLVP